MLHGCWCWLLIYFTSLLHHSPVRVDENTTNIPPLWSTTFFSAVVMTRNHTSDHSIVNLNYGLKFCKQIWLEIRNPTTMSTPRRGARTTDRKFIQVTLPKEYFKPCSTTLTLSAPPIVKQNVRRPIGTSKSRDQPAATINSKHKKEPLDLTSRWPDDGRNKEGKSRHIPDLCNSETKGLATIHYPKHYNVRPIIPAKKKELVSVAKAMHREEFGSRLKDLFKPETNAALDAIDSGVYVGWRCPEYTWDCIRVNKQSRCFCDHNLSEHSPYSSQSRNVKCRVSSCCCKTFKFVPGRPEDIGEWWLQKRPGFNINTWRAKCRCKHDHSQHNPNTRKCKIRGCACFVFDSNFLCAACDRHWENHETFFESSDIRKDKGLPYGEEYLPFHEMPDLRNVVLGDNRENDIYNSIVSGPGAIPRSHPTKLFLELSKNSGRFKK